MNILKINTTGFLEICEIYFLPSKYTYLGTYLYIFREIETYCSFSYWDI